MMMMGFAFSSDTFFLWFCGTCIIIVAAAAFALKLVDDAEEDDDESSGGKGTKSLQANVTWSFPPKEDRHARRLRWSRVLRRAMPPARLPEKAPPCELTPREVVAAFVAAERRLQAASSSSREGGVGVGQVDSHGAGSREEGAAELLDDGMRERIGRKMMAILMDAGPTKRLCPITEEERRGRASRAKGGPAGSELKGMLKCLEEGEEEGVESSGMCPLQLDGEVLITIGKRGVTRELLWRTLAEMTASAQAMESDGTRKEERCSSHLQRGLESRDSVPITIAS